MKFKVYNSGEVTMKDFELDDFVEFVAILYVIIHFIM